MAHYDQVRLIVYQGWADEVRTACGWQGGSWLTPSSGFCDGSALVHLLVDVFSLPFYQFGSKIIGQMRIKPRSNRLAPRYQMRAQLEYENT